MEPEKIIHLRYATQAVNPETNKFLRVRIHPACMITLTEGFLRELRTKHHVADALFLVDGAPWLQAAFHRYNLRFQHITLGDRNTAKPWLQLLVFAQNQLI